MSRHVRLRPSNGGSPMRQLLAFALTTGVLFDNAAAQQNVNYELSSESEPLPDLRIRTSIAGRGPPEDGEEQVPLVVRNQCEDTMWPGIATQAGTGPGTGGFALKSGELEQLWVSSTWQGRVWGRTNCTVDGDSAACETGDCSGQLDCDFSGSTPATLAEFTLAGGIAGMQTFYDISLVDGYNLPLGINYIPAKNTTFIPPNLTNCACIATPGWVHPRNETGIFYSNSSYPIPLEGFETNDSVDDWCPWPNLAFPPKKPGNGIYPYPDDNIQRPEFSPCNSACATTGSDRDCCVGKYHDPNVCKPSRYSLKIKAICPDAYSFAYDDQKSTFIIPKGGGWEVVLCPEGRSTNILRQLGAELNELANEGQLSEMTMRRLRDVAYIEADRGAGSNLRSGLMLLSTTVFAAGLWVVL